MLKQKEHDPEKWRPVFGKDHAQTKSSSAVVELETPSTSWPGLTRPSTFLILLGFKTWIPRGCGRSPGTRPGMTIQSKADWL
jgi:hypothetical protein